MVRANCSQSCHFADKRDRRAAVRISLHSNMARLLTVSLLLVCALHPVWASLDRIIDQHTGPGGHLGCFRDNGNRDLPYNAWYISISNSPQECKAACQRLGFWFAGVQHSTQCFCGNNFGRHGRADNCNMDCPMWTMLLDLPMQSKICGGGWANNVYLVPGYVAEGPLEHYGCFRDNGNRDLPHRAYSGGNSPQQCKATCQRLGFRFAGVQYSKECFCGNTFGRYGRADNCNMHCHDNNDQICGGGLANNVFNAGGYKEPKPEGAMQFFGCFRDNGDRDLPHHVYTGQNSIEQCKAACQRLGFRFAGVQHSNECFCGNSFGRYGRANNCNMQCNGNNGQTCGGIWANSVYIAAYVRKTFSHRGCYRDAGNRDLPRLAYEGSNSVEKCVSACTGLGFRLAGVQYSGQCWCGNSFGKHGPAYNCNMRCSGNNAQVCGGGWANNVYGILA